MRNRFRRWWSKSADSQVGRGFSLKRVSVNPDLARNLRCFANLHCGCLCVDSLKRTAQAEGLLRIALT